MSFAYLPLYTGDYLRDTMHLSCAEHGIYLKLLMYCWDCKGPAPLDERKRCGIVNARSGDEVEALRRVTNEFFVEMEDGWYNERMQNEVIKCEILAKSRSEYGRIGAAIKAQSQVRRAKQAHAKHKLSISQAQAKHELLSPTPTPTPTPIVLSTKDVLSTILSPDGDMSGKPDVSSLKGDRQINNTDTAKRVLIFLNEKAGRRYKFVEANLDFIKARLKEGASEIECRQVIAKKVREWAGDEKMDKFMRPATLFNKTKFAQYVGELVPQEDGDV